LPKGKTKGSPKESLDYGSSGISPDDYFFADSVSVDMHGVFLFIRHGFPPLGNENPALAMALAGVKGKKERALQMERP
jgi:hypothetical protein